jgi:hypothetical protein
VDFSAPSLAAPHSSPGAQRPALSRELASRLRVLRQTFRGGTREGLIEHNKNIVEARTRLFQDYADNHFMTVYGEPTRELIDLVKAHHMENQFKWFSFIKGLDL